MFSFPLIPAPPQRCEQFRSTVHLGKDGFDAHRQSLYDEFGSERVCRILLSQSRVCAACLKKMTTLAHHVFYYTPIITHEHLAMIFKKIIDIPFTISAIAEIIRIWSSVFFFLIFPEPKTKCFVNKTVMLSMLLYQSPLLIFIYPSFGCCLQK